MFATVCAIYFLFYYAAIGLIKIDQLTNILYVSPVPQTSFAVPLPPMISS